VVATHGFRHMEKAVAFVRWRVFQPGIETWPTPRRTDFAVYYPEPCYRM